MIIRLFFLISLLAAFCTAEMQVDVTVKGAPRPLAPEFLGYNGNLCRAGSWSDPVLLDVFQKLEAGHLRYPAGTIANYWDWKTGWFKEGTHPPHGLDRVEANPYTLADLKIACSGGVMPVFVLNMLTSDLAYQLEMLREARRIGLPVKRVELGNEYYLEKPDYIERFPTAEDYVQEANRWAAAIKAEFPDVKVCAVGAAVRPPDGPRRKTWNRIVFPRLTHMDAVAIHVYAGSGMFINKNELFEATGLVETTGARAQKSGIWGSAAQQIAQFNRFNGAYGVVDMLSMPSRRWDSMNDLEALPEGFEVWITEYNLFDRVGPVRGTWAHGLFAATMTLSFLQDERVQMATFHSLYSNPMFCAIYADETAFDGYVTASKIEQPPAPEPYSLSSAGIALKLIGQAMTGATFAQPLLFSEAFEITSPAYGTYPGRIGWLFSDGLNRKALIINLSQTAVAVNLENLSFSSVRQVSYDPREILSEGVALPSTVTGSGQTELKPWSIAVFE